MNKFGIKILPRDVLLDLQGRAVEQSLELGQIKIQNCRVGKYIELEVPGDQQKAKAVVEDIVKRVLHNPLIEKYEIIDIGEVQGLKK